MAGRAHWPKRSKPAGMMVLKNSDFSDLLDLAGSSGQLDLGCLGFSDLATYRTPSRPGVDAHEP
eukprot:9442221-Lingulodinium_polyedra.AAC.1